MFKILLREKEFQQISFTKEAELENVVIQNYAQIFGQNTYYFNLKKGMRYKKGDLLTIPDGYLLKLGNNSSMTIIEHEISTHDAISHIAVQFLKFFSAVTETSKYALKKSLIEYLKENPKELEKINSLITRNGLKNISDVLDSAIMDAKIQYAILIDEKSDELIRVTRLFNPEIYTIKKFQSKNEIMYLIDGEEIQKVSERSSSKRPPMRKLPESDTIVCPAQEDGFNEVFLQENRWFQIRIDDNKLQKIKYLAMYESAPVSAINYVGEVKKIIPYKNTKKYEIILNGPAIKLPTPIKKSKEFPNLAPQGPKYTMKSLLDEATKLEDIFP